MAAWSYSGGPNGRHGHRPYQARPPVFHNYRPYQAHPNVFLHGHQNNGGPRHNDRPPEAFHGHQNDNRPRHNDWALERRLTQGSGGACYVLRSVSTGKRVVQKVVPEQNRRVSCEIIALTQWLKPHAQIIQAFGGSSRTGVLIMEYCAGGDLHAQRAHFDLLRMQGVPTPEMFQVHVFVSLILALAYLHHGIRVIQANNGRLSMQADPAHIPLVHGDLKLANILLKWTVRSPRTGLPEVVVTDFGHCRPVQYPGTVPGTVGHLAPELDAVIPLYYQAHQRFRERMIRDRLLSSKNDVYALGLCMTMVMGWHFEGGSDPGALRPRYLRTHVLLHGIQDTLEVDRRDRISMDASRNGMLATYLRALLEARHELLRIEGPVPRQMWASPPG